VKEALKYPAVVFDGYQALSIAQGFARMVEKSGYRIHACAILPEHVHLVIGRHAYRVEQVVRLLKAESSTKLEQDGRHPLARWRQPDGSLPTPWARNCWKVFLETLEDIHRAIVYVEQNPIKEGKRRQHWSFVVPYNPL
jgi:REP element-mobilizing transposase RayT